jgi:hypothetical protein
MAQSDVDHIKEEISDTFDGHVSGTPASIPSMFPTSKIGGKLYEAHVLSQVCEQLASVENFDLRLSRGNKVRLKSSPGQINRSYPCIQLRNPGGSGVEAEMWTDVEFVGLSYQLRGGSPSQADRSDWHELDILVTENGLANGSRPKHSEIWLGVECKYRDFSKGFLKEMLGVRRQMSYIKRASCDTKFDHWPDDTVTESPPSCLLLYCRDQKIDSYTEAPEQFDIHMIHSSLPTP